MERPHYWRAAVCGLVATYMMSVAAHWVAALGLPRGDPSRLMAYSMKAPYLSGLAAHYMNGIILGMMYARWGRLVPGGNCWAKGVWVGILTTVAAQVVVGVVGPRGFFWNAPAPAARLATSLFAHLVFGVALAVAYAREEEA